MQTPLNELSAAEAARRIESRELTAEALAAACLERIAERDDAVRAWAARDCALGQGAQRRTARGRSARRAGQMHPAM
jgi:Asp-tRNA(Asn)/Glu-tRNA(Gln) amidotransferase A subunit family amidase